MTLLRWAPEYKALMRTQLGIDVESKFKQQMLNSGADGAGSGELALRQQSVDCTCVVFFFAPIMSRSTHRSLHIGAFTSSLHIGAFTSEPSHRSLHIESSLFEICTCLTLNPFNSRGTMWRRMNLPGTWRWSVESWRSGAGTWLLLKWSRGSCPSTHSPQRSRLNLTTTLTDTTSLTHPNHSFK
jgi:hypothetical protein